ncbi:hypothetical protein FDENT_13261 [Fusarium denticulatum]|uniref:Uncharacterized protein n=1 Tax=Fusarium denticulatum TaxID=48507 RepID=A0A8H5T5F7_9HYPO|nr:hypothetical protein FDENT_13261 [Fusarium denticulatum]
MPPQSTPTPVPDAAAPLISAQILADTEVTSNRIANTTITEAKGYSLLEKISFRDLLQEYCATRPTTGDNSLTLTAELQNSFFEKVFLYWDSKETFVSLPRLLPKKLQQTPYEAGLFQPTRHSLKAQAWSYYIRQ